MQTAIMVLSSSMSNKQIAGISFLFKILKYYWKLELKYTKYIVEIWARYSKNDYLILTKCLLMISFRYFTNINQVTIITS